MNIHKPQLFWCSGAQVWTHTQMSMNYNYNWDKYSILIVGIVTSDFGMIFHTIKISTRGGPLSYTVAYKPH